MAGNVTGIAIRALASKAQTPIDTVLHLIGRRRLQTDEALNFGDDQLVYSSGGDDGAVRGSVAQSHYNSAPFAGGARS